MGQGNQELGTPALVDVIEVQSEGATAIGHPKGHQVAILWPRLFHSKGLEWNWIWSKPSCTSANPSLSVINEPPADAFHAAFMLPATFLILRRDLVCPWTCLFNVITHVNDEL